MASSDMYLLIILVASFVLVASVAMPNTSVALSDLIVILYLSYLIKTLFIGPVNSKSKEEKTSDKEEESSEK